MRIAGVIIAFMTNAVVAAAAPFGVFLCVVIATLLIVVILEGPRWITALTEWSEAKNRLSRRPDDDPGTKELP